MELWPYQGNRCPVPLCSPFSVHQRENPLTECIVSWDGRNNVKYVSGCLKIRRKCDWRPNDAVIPTYFVLEFNMNKRIRNKSYEEAKIRDILRPGKTQAGTRDTEAEIRDIPGNTGRLATLVMQRNIQLIKICYFRAVYRPIVNWPPIQMGDSEAMRTNAFNSCRLITLVSVLVPHWHKVNHVKNSRQRH